MTKRELIAKVAERTGATKATVQDILDAFRDVIIDTLKKGERITLQNFGTYEIRHFQARIARLHGKEHKVPEMNLPAFKFSKKIRDEVRAALS